MHIVIKCVEELGHNSSPQLYTKHFVCVDMRIYNSGKPNLSYNPQDSIFWLLLKGEFSIIILTKTIEGSMLGLKVVV